MISYERIIATATRHLRRSEAEEQAFRADTLTLEQNALVGAAVFETAHTLAVGMGLFTPEEQENEEFWRDPQAIMNECAARLAKREFTVEQYIAFLSMEYEFGLRVGMELGLEMTREENADAEN